MLPLLSLMGPKIYPRLAYEACPRGGGAAARRSTSLFFRGAHGTGEAAQAVRAKLSQLRSLPKVDVKFTRGGPTKLLPRTKEVLTAAGHRDVRLPYNTLTYASGMLHSDFCLLPRGETTNPGRRFIDAVAAGCIPFLIGDAIRPPLSSLLAGALANFTVRLSESEFTRYPTTAVTDTLKEAVPRLGALRKALLAAREDLLLATGTSPLAGNMSDAHGADLVLLEAGRTFCPRTPTTFKACVDSFAR